mgnify:CR=1 FL=1
METMPRESAWFLIVKYPTLRDYIHETYNSGAHEELIDFLFAIETEPSGLSGDV